MATSCGPSPGAFPDAPSRSDSGGDALIAIFHLSAQIISRSSGRTSVGAAAYRSGTCLTCERDGRTHDYTHRRDVVHSEIVLPAVAPSRWLDRSVLWNEVERTERGGRAQLCREINVALPRELSRAEQLALARRYAKAFADEGMIVDWALHDKDGSNPHLHLMLSLRPSTSEGFGPKSCNAYLVRNVAGDERHATADELKALGKSWQKVYRYKGGKQLTKAEAKDAGLDPIRDRKSKVPVQVTRSLTGWGSSEKLVEWRRRWAAYANEALAASGSTERIDHRSNRERHVELIPSLHEGPTVTQLEREAKARAHREGREYVPVTDRRRQNIRIARINKWLREVIRMITKLLLVRAEHAKTTTRKRDAQRQIRKSHRRAKQPYAPSRGRRTGPTGGLSK